MKLRILHITILLLLGTLISFILYLVNKSSVYSIISTLLPTMAAILELIRNNKDSQKIEKEFSVRPPTQFLSQSEYDELNRSGELDSNTLYYIKEKGEKGSQDK